MGQNTILSWIGLASLLIPFVSALAIAVPSQALQNTPTRISWTLDPGDASEWDFRFVQNGQDAGLAAANVKSDGTQTGQVDVTFPSKGNFVLAAVVGPNHDIIGQSSTTQVVDTLSTSSSSVQTSKCCPSVSITTVISSPTSTINTFAKQRSVHVPAIVGGIVGGLIFILLMLILFILVRRRRKNQSEHTPEIREVRHTERKSWIQRIIPSTSVPPVSPRAGTGGPRGPRPATKSEPLPRTLIMRPPRTERQQILDNMVTELLEELGELQQEDNWRESGASVRVQEVWTEIRFLRGMKESAWALGETDELPHEWERSMV
ncbi:hypothetical protein BDQ17DRAFT_1364109 [Cyathus striatus]|nr:hypothetical protein BDQ17DRAFT_1364109 [Cyathus striatus]